jgi:hypothetical protein
MSGSDSTTPAIVIHGATVLERVLLAIIIAHTTDQDEDCRAERLQTAMTALIGPARPDGHDMERALLYMVRERQKDICDFEMQALRLRAPASRSAIRPIPELATVAARDVVGCTTVAEVEATVSALREMFRQRCRDYEVEPDHVREAQEAEAVQRILSELAECDVPARL